jgi:tetratricopeptide (TPR) repeat protein
LGLISSFACGAEGDLPRDEDRTTEILGARTRGLTYLQQDRLEDAAIEFDRLTELAPEESAGPANLALVALRRSDFGEAERWARLAVEREPEDPAAHLILAKALELRGRLDEATAQRERVLELDPDNLRALWTLAGADAEREDPPPASSERIDLLTRVVQRAPSSLPARLELVEARLARGDAGPAAAQLEELRALIPEFPAGAAEAFDQALSAARAEDAVRSRGPAERFHDLMRMTPAYQAGAQDLRGPLGAATGFVTLSFSHEIALEIPDESAGLVALRFTDATAISGLGSTLGTEGEVRPGDDAAPVVAVGDFDGDGDQDLYAWHRAAAGGGPGFLLRNDLGRFVDVTPDVVRDVGSVRAARFVDYDGDGLLDLYLVREGPNHLFENLDGERFQDVSRSAAVADPGDGRSAVFADLDHDGDLDLLVANQDGNPLYRNDGQGRFAPVPGSMGLDGPAMLDVSFADFDDDGDLDVVAAWGDGIELFANLRQERFSPGAVSAGLGDASAASAVAVGDYDNDGHPDLVVSGRSSPRIYRNLGDGRFERDDTARGLLAERAGARAAFLDFDNDGRLDLAVSGAGAEAPQLLHNDGSGAFVDRSQLLPPELSSVERFAVFDYNEDGDLDLLAASARGLLLLRNDGGNVNHHLDLSLLARGAGSGKVNRIGVGSKVEIRAADLYQAKTVRSTSTHFGLGHRLKADVVRIVWTNGVPQYLYLPGTDQDLIESQELKGSCAFVYAWDGERYEFVTDAMWRSAIGMPLGIMGGRASRAGRLYAPPAASREYLRIPGARLRPDGGRYRLQITEELWEVAYVDEVKLLAIDHSDSVELFVDEKFVPPAPAELHLFRVVRRLLPVSARDGRGNDVLKTLSAQDARYVSSLQVGPYQGIVTPHEIVLELPADAASAERPFLFLQGWIFPTDASINVAVSQSDAVAVMSPRLEVPDGRGGWRTAIPDIGFPSGKDKTVVVDLTGSVVLEDPRIRIRTNMQVYWDHAFFAVGAVAGPAVAADAEAAARLAAFGSLIDENDLRIQLLRPAAADLHYRGFSREYRKSGRHGPHWFEYVDVSRDSPWLPIEGRYTRYGDVTPLVGGSDDMYTVMAPGDEMTVEFDTVSDPPDGWTRTFLLYTDGWIKDADLNTATGNTVEPLPFHAQSRYPHGPDDIYPADPAHRDYLARYHTREVSGSTLRLAPRAGSRR